MHDPGGKRLPIKLDAATNGRERRDPAFVTHGPRARDDVKAWGGQP